MKKRREGEREEDELDMQAKVTRINKTQDDEKVKIHLLQVQHYSSISLPPTVRGQM